MKDRPTKMRFLVQEHHSRQLHYDFRLEMAGVLKSWALPKGPSLNPADKRLAVVVDDHPLEYFGFEGIIPAGQYGAGPVVVWDKGGYSLLEGDDPVKAFGSGRIVMELRGKILRGGFTLVKMKGRGEKNWLLIKRKDEYSKTNWILQQALTKEKERLVAVLLLKSSSQKLWLKKGSKALQRILRDCLHFPAIWPLTRRNGLLLNTVWTWVSTKQNLCQKTLWPGQI